MATTYQLREQRFHDQISEDVPPPFRFIGTFSTLEAAQAYPRVACYQDWEDVTCDTDDCRWWSSGADDRNYYITEEEDDE